MQSNSHVRIYAGTDMLYSHATLGDLRRSSTCANTIKYKGQHSPRAGRAWHSSLPACLRAPFMTTPNFRCRARQNNTACLASPQKQTPLDVANPSFSANHTQNTRVVDGLPGGGRIRARRRTKLGRGRCITIPGVHCRERAISFFRLRCVAARVRRGRGSAGSTSVG